MSAKLRILLLVGLSLSAAFSILAQAPHEPTPAATPDDGTVVGRVYENKYFGLTLTIPEDWQIQDASMKEQIKEKGKEVITSNDPKTKEALNRAADRTINLLTVMHFEAGATSPNGAFICGAEKVPSEIVKDADYVAILKESLKHSQIPYTIERDTYAETIGGTEFAVVDMLASAPGLTFRQRYYAHIEKGYGLFFIVTYQSDEALKAQTAILKSAVFR